MRMSASSAAGSRSHRCGDARAQRRKVVLLEVRRVAWDAYGRASVQLTYWSYQAADAAREFRSR